MDAKRFCFCCVVGLLFSAGPVLAESYDWKSPASGYWSDTSKWNPTGYPSGPEDTAEINQPEAVVTLLREVNIHSLRVEMESALIVNGSSGSASQV